LGSIEIYQDTVGADAFMAFHVASDFAAYFGLKGDINDFAVGGWSMGDTYYRLWHSGNDGAGSGLDADLLDGLSSASFIQTPGSSSTFISSNSGGAVNPDNTTVNGLYYCTSISLFGQTDGALYSQAYNSDWQGQIFQDYRTGQLALRGKNAGTWQGWRTNWDSGNDGAGSGLDADLLDGIDSSQFLRSDANDSFSGEITMSTQKALIASDYGHGIYGVYSPTRYQHVWSMGTSYNLPANGLDESGPAGNLYGLAWSYHPNYSYAGSNPQAKDGLDHQLLLMMNGTTYTALGNGIWTSGNVTIGGSATISGNTAWHAGNDGAGSGLDADLLDGLDSGSFLRSDAADTGTGSITLSTGNSQPLRLQTSSGSPWALELYRSDLTLSSKVFAHNIPYNGWYFEHNISIAGNTNWHSGNDGAGSGLDADTVDGFHGAKINGLAVLGWLG
jgi:hypothetical protein